MSYSSTVLADSPLAFWRLGDSSGTTATDSSGNSRPGAYVGSPTLGSTGLLTGDLNTAITCNGSSQQVSTTYASWQDASSTFSIEAWIKPATVSGTHVIAARQEVAVGSGVWTFRLEGTTLKLYNWDSGGSLQGSLNASTVFAVGTVYHVVAVFTPSGTRAIYVNGAVDVSASASTIITASSPVRIGADGNGASYSGVVDEVAYYGTALSGTRIAAHYTAGTAAPPDATVTPPVATASASASVPVVSASSSVAPAAATASASAPVPAVGSFTSATVAPPAATASASAPVPAITQVIPAATDTSNFLNGRNRRARASVTVDRPAAATPTRAAVKYDKAVPYPPPTLVDGRVT